jgi:threonine aldolase
MYSFKNDYTEGAHPQVLDMLLKTNMEQHDGYGEDDYCRKAAEMVRELVGNPDVDVHFISGGTQANAIGISAALKPYEAVITADTGHINVHEAGAIESRGHKVLSVTSKDGKLTPRGIESMLSLHTNEHMVKPRLVFLSNATETGTIYSRHELIQIAECCRANHLYLYLDGARIGCALTAKGNDLTMSDICRLTDMFYIGGTKNGALAGEAMVIRNEQCKPDFRYAIKQNGGLLSKSRLFGIQFCALLNDNLYFELAANANNTASRLAKGIADAGYGFLNRSETNQIFPILPNTVIEAMSRQFSFYVWKPIDEHSSAIRLVTSWATTEKAVMRFVAQLNAVQ